MLLVKMIIALVILHLGFGFTQMAVSYFSGDTADYGAVGIISHTPLGSFIDLDNPPGSDGAGQANPSQFRRVLDFANNLGDIINGLASFGYGFLTDIDADDGAVYNVVMAFRIASALFTIALGMAVIYFLFDSNILTSTLGLGLVAGGATITGALSALGALF